MLWAGGKNGRLPTLVHGGETMGQVARRWVGIARVRRAPRIFASVALPEAPDVASPPVARPAPGRGPSAPGSLGVSETSPSEPSGVAEPQARPWRPWLIGLLLYLGAATLLLANLAWHPPVFFNWEEYSAWGIFAFLDTPQLAHFAPTDGLMTNSGHSPFVVGPVLLGWHFWGVGSLLGFRLPIALLAATAVPLCWRLGRRLIGGRPALLAAVFLLLSPVYLLYARTATLVGLSLVPALATAWLLLRVLDRPTVARVALLQVAFIANGFGYAPIRFLWLIALAALTLECLLRSGLWRRLAPALLATALTLPAWLWGLAAWEARARGETTRPILKLVLKQYYNGRGEHILVEADRLPALGDLTAYVGRNLADSLRLFFDLGTSSVITDFWNTHGRLQPAVLVLPCLVGLGRVAWCARRSHEARLLLLLFAGFWLPLLLTSQVHVGRLIYVVPLLALFAAAGTIWLIEQLGVLLARLGFPAQRRTVEATGKAGRGLRWSLVGLLLCVVASATWTDYRVDPLVEHLARDVLLMQGRAPALAAAHQAAVLIVNTEEPENEAIIAGGYRLRLERDYRFVDLARPAPRLSSDPADTRPLLLYGGDPGLALDRESLCAATYYAPTDRVPQMTALVAALTCATPPSMVTLPR